MNRNSQRKDLPNGGERLPRRSMGERKPSIDSNDRYLEEFSDRSSKYGRDVYSAETNNDRYERSKRDVARDLPTTGEKTSSYRTSRRYDYTVRSDKKTRALKEFFEALSGAMEAKKEQEEAEQKQKEEEKQKMKQEIANSKNPFAMIVGGVGEDDDEPFDHKTYELTLKKITTLGCQVKTDEMRGVLNVDPHQDKCCNGNACNFKCCDQHHENDCCTNCPIDFDLCGERVRGNLCFRRSHNGHDDHPRPYQFVQHCPSSNSLCTPSGCCQDNCYQSNQNMCGQNQNCCYQSCGQPNSCNNCCSFNP